MNIVEILSRHAAISHRGHYVCAYEECDWEAKFSYKPEDAHNPVSGPRIAFAEHLADLLQDVLAEIWEEGAEAATEHWTEHMYDKNENGPADPPLNPYLRDNTGRGPGCPRCYNERGVWVKLFWGEWGYRCRDCYAFVTLPRVDTGER